MNDPHPVDSMADWGTGPARDDPITLMVGQMEICHFKPVEVVFRSTRIL